MKSHPEIAVVVLIALAISAACQPAGNQGGNPSSTLTREEATEQLAQWHDKRQIVLRTTTTSSGRTTLGPTGDNALIESAPDPAIYPPSVEAAPRSASAEIWCSTEKCGEGRNGWMSAEARLFNASDARTRSGARAQITIRPIASGTAYLMMLKAHRQGASQGALPDAYSPSNALWINMLNEQGVETVPIAQRTVANPAYVLASEEAATKLGITPDRCTHTVEPAAMADHKETIRICDEGSGVALDQIVERVADVGEHGITMGYTNPYASSTGLNFAASVLHSYARQALHDGAEQAEIERSMLTPQVKEAFGVFQESVPYVALTTLQLRQSVEEGGRLDAFVMEHQSIATSSQTTPWLTIPFGSLHTNPLHALDTASEETRETLALFAQALQSEEAQARAIEQGFPDPAETPVPQGLPVPAGSTLVEVQRLWRQEKSARQPITAVFVADSSGSMKGRKIARLKQALEEATRTIQPGNRLGIVEFDSSPRVVFPVQTIEPDDVRQRAQIAGAIESMSAGGSTALSAGILSGLSLLVKERAEAPDRVLLLIVLADGQADMRWHMGRKEERIARGLEIQINTIGFMTDDSAQRALKDIASWVEGASLSVDSQTSRHKLASMMHALM